MASSFKDFFSKRQQIDSYQQVCIHLLEESLRGNVFFLFIVGKAQNSIIENEPPF